MAGQIALCISSKMVTQLNLVKRQLETGSEAISCFFGYLDALQDTQMISAYEAQAFRREFTRMLIE